ncbi:MAG: EVE domain-containing protein [Deltaproteobacteria bacterium]|nr:EVE domain-containing protein [Kofleriaceae bacterium]
MTFAEAAEAVLVDTRRAMSASELWAEIDKRGLVQTKGKTPSATLYTELLRRSANWLDEEDEKQPTFYRRGDGAFGLWADLTAPQQKAILDGGGTSPTAIWRDLHDRVKDDPVWVDRLAALKQRRAEVGAQIADRIRKYLAGSLGLEAFRTEFDKQTRRGATWDTFGFGGISFAMVLNQFAKTVALHPDLESLIKSAMAASSDDKVARANVDALVARLEVLRKTGDKKKLPHPNRAITLFSALWQVQAPDVWPTYYKSARDALAETGVVEPDEDDAIASYFAFRVPYQKLASELGLSILELEQLCKLQQAEEDDATAAAASWLFQVRPDVFDLRTALDDLDELTWVVRQQKPQVHEGDTVYLWESGDDAALLAVARVVDAPATTPREAPAQAKFYKNPADAEGDALRVRLAIDRRIDPPLTRQRILAAPETGVDAHLFSTAQNINVELPAAIAALLEGMIATGSSASQVRYWKIAPGGRAYAWPEMERDGVIAISWYELQVGDLRAYASKQALEQRIAELAPDLKPGKCRRRAEQLWAFRNISIGDVIVANRGYSAIVGEGKVTGDYFFRAGNKFFPHARPVQWTLTKERAIPDQGPKWRPTVVALSADEYDDLFADDELDAKPEPDHQPPTNPSEAEPYTLQHALKQVFLAESELEGFLDLLKYKKNLLLQGPPGVGKTFVASELAYVLLGAKDDARIKRVQFHQSYAYEDFVRGYRPAEGGGFVLRDGPMFTFSEQARQDSSRPYVMIIDEINRGNLSKILGELMLLVEPDKRDPKWAVELAYAKPGEAPFSVPPNLHIIGTMNTADRSIALVDYALRRRFVFATVQPAFAQGRFRTFLESRGVAPPLRDKLIERIADLNKTIADDARNLGPGYVIGHSYFCQRDPQDAYDDAWYTRIVRYEVEPLLHEYWAESPEKVKKMVEALLA